MLSRLETCIVYSCIWSVTLAKSIVPRKTWRKLWHSCISKLFLTKIQVKFSPPKPEVILTNFFAEPTVLLVPITSRDHAIQRNTTRVWKYIDFLNKIVIYWPYMILRIFVKRGAELHFCLFPCMSVVFRSYCIYTRGQFEVHKK
jgi:hypothetical protein